MPGLLRFSGSVKRDPAIDAWLAARRGDLRDLATPWFTRMRRCGPDVRELMHDGLATACVDDAPFAYIGIYRSHVNVGFFHGADLPNGAGLLQGTGRRLRHVKLKPGGPIDEAALAVLIEAAYAAIGMRAELAS